MASVAVGASPVLQVGDTQGSRGSGLSVGRFAELGLHAGLKCQLSVSKRVFLIDTIHWFQLQDTVLLFGTVLS